MSRAIRLVLALYPRPVRDRYGPEIADLLTHSRRPVRDLANVARCALAERRQALTYARMRPHLNATTGLVAAPMAFAGIYLAFFALCALVFAAVAAVAGPSSTGQSLRIVSAVGAFPIAAGAIWLAGHARLPFTSALAPTGLAVGALPLVLLLNATSAWPMAAALGCWWVVTGALSTVAVALVRRGRRRSAVLTMALGGVLACELAFAVYGLLVLGSAFVVFGVYPVAALGIDPQIIGATAGHVADQMTIMPALLTICSAYTLGLVTTAHPARRCADYEPTTQHK
ncbi:hypothetical protein GCM10010399_35240 [Dactylosporangium fulvum]|uniref:Integral membrane protein n=1 Tax=Dactylosporangium fulvum TaxID=53359 RepID=A0ABY5VZ03_9ACTN|nr:hypothetical protein [Dactylosporangium fulvum]UWP82389.1 hypothetical protein Dfulv_46335 [Dactylosporangium fulvum]